MNDIMPLKPVRRSYSADFKAELVKASQQPGVSLAGLALRHGLNANLLRRWVREHEREGKHLATQSDTAMPFVAVSLPAPVSSHSCQLQMQGKGKHPVKPPVLSVISKYISFEQFPP